MWRAVIKHLLTVLLLMFLVVGCGQVTISPTETGNPSGLPIVSTVTPSPLPTETSSSDPYFYTDRNSPAYGNINSCGHGPTNFPANVDPLTGLVVSNPGLLDRRPIAIKVNIVPRSSNRPPWGLSYADIVYDYYHNDGYSRFHAIFYGSDAKLVGPIRIPDAC